MLIESELKFWIGFSSQSKISAQTQSNKWFYVDCHQELGTSIPDTMTETKAAELGKMLANMQKAKKAEGQQISEEDWKNELSKYDRKRLSALETALHRGDLDPETYLAQLFRNDMKENETYQKASQDRQHAIRKEWLKKKQMTDFEVKHQYSKGYRKVDWTKGEYLNFSQLIHAEGGIRDPDAVVGSLKLVCRAMALGPPWISSHVQTERTTYLYFKMGFQ